MTSSRIAIVLAAWLAGCQHEVETIELTGRTGDPLMLRSADDLEETDVATFRWELVASPEGSPDLAPAARTSVVTVTPTRRGVYVYDRWIEQELGDDLTTHFLVTVDGRAPEPQIGALMTTKVGSPVALAGFATASVAPENLTFRWRLTSRPFTSIAMIATPEAAATQIVPDVRGDYEIALEVFDGELWSTAPARVTFDAEP